MRLTMRRVLFVVAVLLLLATSVYSQTVAGTRVTTQFGYDIYRSGILTERHLLTQQGETITYYPELTPAFSGQWTVNGALCAAGQLVQGGDPTTCTSTPVVINNALGTTTLAGFSLLNQTAAAAGAQQYSPGFSLIGAGWKTTATAASQAVEVRQEVRPTQSTTAPRYTWNLFGRVNGGSWSDLFSVSGYNGTLNLYNPRYVSMNTDTQYGAIHNGGFNTDGGFSVTGYGNVAGDSGALTLDARLAQLPVATEIPGTADQKYFHFVTGAVQLDGTQEIWNGHFASWCITDGTGVCSSGRHNDGAPGGEALPLFDICGGGRITQAVNSGITTGVSIRGNKVPGYVLKTLQSAITGGGNGSVEWSPMHIEVGAAWNSVGAVSESHAWGTYVETTAAAGATKSKWHLARTLAQGEDGTFTDRISMTGKGQMAIIGTAGTCSSNCGTSPSVAGGDTVGRLTMGGTGSPASGFVLTFAETWAAAPVCTVQMALTGMAVGKMPLTVVTTTTTMTVVTNGVAPSTSDVYVYRCDGIQ
jgi:hypothetical protein